MSGISGVNGYSQAGSYYSALSSGKKINSAADGASELAILSKEDSQVKGYDAGSGNIRSGQSAAKIADGALSGVTDYLQRMKELALKASNGLLSNDDKKAIQSEIDQIKQGINDIASSTSYNEHKLLDGSEDSIDITGDGNGASNSVNNVNSTLDALGIKDFNVMGNFDIRDIDNALDKVSGGRSVTGADFNGLESMYNYNQVASYNTSASKSKLGDTDIGEYVTNLQKQQTLDTMKTLMQKKKEEQDGQETMKFFASI
ncbi:MAG: flagellin FliC5 [Lachnospiraceae bacterium]|nr:flagellin FliC5 [Lachnospiraceae bacterium]